MHAYEWPIGAEGWYVEWVSRLHVRINRRLFANQETALAYARDCRPFAAEADVKVRHVRIQLLPD